MARIPKKVSERLTKQTRKFQKILREQKTQDINESDTVHIVVAMLNEIFGFEEFREITAEYKIKGQFCDLAVKTDDKVKYLIEVKAIDLDLKENHLRQVISYGADAGIQWVVLTNGVDWEIYRIKFEKPLGHELLCTFNILDLKPHKKEAQENLFLLCKEGISRDVIQEYSDHKKNVNKFRISAVLQSDTGLNMIRKGLRKVSPGVKVDTDEIYSILTNDVLKHAVVEGADFEEAVSSVRKAYKQVKVKPKQSKASPL